MKISFLSRNFYESSLHVHGEHEIMLMLSSGNEIMINGICYPISRGSLFLLKSMDYHRISSSEQVLCQYYRLQFFAEEVDMLSTPNFDLLQCFNQHLRKGHKIQLDSEQCENLLRLINYSEYYLGRECTVYGKEVYMKLKFAELLIYIDSIFQSLPNVTEEVQENARATEVMPIIFYLQKNYQKKISLDALAATFFVSKSHLCRIFKETTGITINDYLTALRILKAKKLLASGANVKTVSKMVGYSSTEHFIRTFQKGEGVSPKLYARSAK